MTSHKALSLQLSPLQAELIADLIDNKVSAMTVEDWSGGATKGQLVDVARRLHALAPARADRRAFAVTGPRPKPSGKDHGGAA